MDLQKIRDEIRKTDEEMARLFVRRMEAVREVAAFKRERGLPIEDKEQEARVIRGRSALISDPEMRPFYVSYLQETMEISKRWQHYLMRGIRVAYSGVEGAFAHIAAGRIFPDGTLESYPSFEAAYESVTDGECEAAVLPIENSFAGEVGQVLDLMFSGPLYVNGVYDLSISRNLLAETAELYGLRNLDHDINESKVNTTRFAVFSRSEDKNARAREGGAFILLFTVKDEAGGLAKAINVISEYDFNMRVLRSRPMKALPWHYYFYAEVEGDDASEKGREMLRALRAACPILKIVGRYTTGADTQQGGQPI